MGKPSFEKVFRKGTLNVGSKISFAHTWFQISRTRTDEAALVGLVLQDEPESFQASRLFVTTGLCTSSSLSKRARRFVT